MNIPGLKDAETTVFHAPTRRVTVVAKWWMRPVCWLLRKPTTRTVWR